MSPATDANRVLTVKHTWYKVVGYVCIIFFLFCTVMAWRAGEQRAAAALLVFIALGVLLILGSGSMQMNSQWIRYKLPFRSYEIRWDEVKHIEIDSKGGNMAFVGENKMLAVNGPVAWNGKDKLEMRQFIAAQMKTYGIEMRQTEKAMFRLSKNTTARD